MAASLQTSQPPQHNDTDSDSDDQFEADLQRAIEASKVASQSTSSPGPIQPTTQPQSTFISERAQLEKARLERQKRLRGDVEEEEPDSDDAEDVRPAKRQHISSSSGSRFNNASSNSPTTSTSHRASGPSSSGDGFFWDGEIRQTGNIYADPKKDSKPTFRLTDIIGDVSYVFIVLRFLG